MTPELTDKACKYLLGHPDEHFTVVFNKFCDENNLKLDEEDAFYLIDLFLKLSKIDENIKLDFLNRTRECE